MIQVRQTNVLIQLIAFFLLKSHHNSLTNMSFEKRFKADPPQLMHILNDECVCIIIAYLSLQETLQNQLFMLKTFKIKVFNDLFGWSYMFVSNNINRISMILGALVALPIFVC